MRTARINRKTAETDIELKLTLDGSGESEIKSGSGFIDHMLSEDIPRTIDDVEAWIARA